MKTELPRERRTAYNMSILSPMKLKFDMMRGILQPNKRTKFRLILT